MITLLVWCYGLNCISVPKLYVRDLIPNVTLSGDRACKEVVKHKLGMRVGLKSDRISVPLRRGRNMRIYSF